MVNSWFNGHPEFWFYKFACPDVSHQKFERGYHVILCNKPKNDPKNPNLLEDYKAKCIKPDSHHKDLSKNSNFIPCRQGSE